MADPLSLVASLIAIVQISGLVISCCYEYRKGVKNAPKDLLRVTNDVAALRNVVERFITLVDDDKTANHKYLSTLAHLVSADGPLQGCQRDLETLKVKLEPPVGEWKTLGRRLTWPIHEKDVTKTLASIYGTKSLLETALLVDNTTSIIEIRETTKDLRKRFLDFAHSDSLSLEMQLKTVLEWLNGPDQSSKHNEVRNIRRAHTGMWFLKQKDYDFWCEETNSMFWIYGISGCGKTVLCSTIIEDVIYRLHEDQKTAVLYYYFDFRNKIQSSVETLLRSLMAQLVKQTSTLPKALDQLRQAKRIHTLRHSRYVLQAESVAQPSVIELLTALCDSVAEFDHIFIIIDALDECTERQKLLSIVQRLLDSRSEKMHILVTSRSDADLEEQLTPMTTAHILLESSLIEPDIRLYIQEQLYNNPKLRRWPQRVQENIESSLMTGAQGMFRWVACQIEVLSKSKTLKQLEFALRTPPKDLIDTYRRALEGLDPDSYEIVCKVLRLLTVSPRPIRLDEAVEFIAIDTRNEEGLVFDPDMRLLDPHDLSIMCSSLVSLSRTFIRNKAGVVVEDIQELHLAHSSVKEFLVLHFQEQRLPPVLGNIDSQAYAAECCVVYLLQFRDPLTDDRDVCDLPLARYAAEFWIRHLQSSETKTSPTGTQSILKLMDDSLMPFSNWRRLYDPDKPWRGTDLNASKYASPVYYASQSGLEDLVDRLLKNGSKPDEGIGIFGTPLQVAAYNGHLGVAQLLLSAGADPNQRCGKFYTPLKAAAAGGHADLVRLLIQRNADPNVHIAISGTALFEATICRYPEITRILIDAEADVNITGNRKAEIRSTTNPLVIASQNLDLEIVSQLLSRASTTTIAAGLSYAAGTKSRELLELYAAYDPDGVLHYAAKLGLNDLVISLLQKNVGGTSTLKLGCSHEHKPNLALVAAACEGHLSIVQEMISAQANVNAAVGDGSGSERYALESAADNDSGSIVSLLIKNGALVNTCGSRGTALQHASDHGNADMVTELLDHGADPDIGHYFYGSSLQAAVEKCHHHIVQLLLDRGANINAQARRYSTYDTALTAAIPLANNDMIDFLLSRGARVDLKTDLIPPALYVAAKAGIAALIPKLLSFGAELESQFRGKSPLYAAVKKGHLAAVRQLLESGANANHCISDYGRRVTILDAAIEQGSEDVLRLLIKFGGDVNKVSETIYKPEPPLLRATEKGRLGMVRVLLEHGADCSWRGSDELGWTALHLAAHGHPDILRLLCDDSRVDLSLRLSNDSLALHSAAWKGSVECIEILLARNMDIDARNNLGRTPLHFAAEQGNFDAVDVLLRHGARIDVKEEESQMTPLDHAKMQLGKSSEQGNFQRIVQILEERSFQTGA